MPNQETLESRGIALEMQGKDSRGVQVEAVAEKPPTTPPPMDAKQKNIKDKKDKIKNACDHNDPVSQRLDCSTFVRNVMMELKINDIPIPTKVKENVIEEIKKYNDKHPDKKEIVLTLRYNNTDFFGWLYANDLIDCIADVNSGWIKCADVKAACNASSVGDLVFGGLKGSEFVSRREHGHVVLVLEQEGKYDPTNPMVWSGSMDPATSYSNGIKTLSGVFDETNSKKVEFFKKVLS